MVFFPYEELKIQKSSSNSTYQVNVPWLALELNFDSKCGFDPDVVADLIHRSQVNSAEDVRKISLLLSALRRYPIWYALPRPARDKLTTYTTFEYPPTGDWDEESALAFSQSSDGFHDPLTLLTILRRYSLLHLSHNPHHTALYGRLRQITGDEFRSLAASSLRQNHFITEHCIEALTPALEHAKNSRAVLESYINSERGHDRFLEQAIQDLGYQPSELEVKTETRSLMDLLLLASKTNFVAFAAMIDLFEAGGGSNRHPLSVILAEKGFKVAAKQLDAHRSINLAGGHSSVAETFLVDYPHIPRPVATHAIRLLEDAADNCARISPEL